MAPNVAAGSRAGVRAAEGCGPADPGWAATVTDDGLGGALHTVAVTTPTGHTYTSRAAQPP